MNYTSTRLIYLRHFHVKNMQLSRKLTAFFDTLIASTKLDKIQKTPKSLFFALRDPGDPAIGFQKMSNNRH
ncbi:MAG: hypothetical protein ACTSQI_06130 [Candidatus Helarchaeota archaeon]